MGPLVVGVDGEVRNDWHVGDLDLIEMLVDDHRRVERVFAVSRDVLLGEITPHELLERKKWLIRASVSKAREKGGSHYFYCNLIFRQT